MFLHLIIVVLGLQTKNVLSDTNYRLNSLVKPSAYFITITPFFKPINSFNGKVNIIINPTVNTKQIKLHSENLIFSASNITVADDKTINPVTSLEFDTKYTFAYINLQNELKVGVEYSLEIMYTGAIINKLNGFYGDSYYVVETEKVISNLLGVTQMEPTFARKVFPCFDEPSYKAVFTLIIDRPDGFKPSVSNMKLHTSVPLSNGYTRDIFYPSPKMSTYLVAFLISDLETTRSASGNLGVYTRPNAKNQTEYTLDFGVRVLSALNDYFGIDYYSSNPHLKLDHVALRDHYAGAMENWGLVTYREYLLLYAPEDSTPDYKLKVAQSIAHETTHQWFGNLVTCHWWSDLWLNEGFARYFNNYITAIIEPDLGTADLLVTDSLYKAYAVGELPESGAISNNSLNSPAEIEGTFGTISYHTAGSVIRMMHHLLGDKAFQLGLQTYLKANQFDVATPENLYAALNQAAINTSALSDYPGSTVAGIMAPWITQPGFPVLTVNIDYENETITLTQKRFYANSSYKSNETYSIPITYTTELAPNFNKTKPAFIMKGKSLMLLNMTGLAQKPWVIYNLQETGFYRVNYDEHTWKIIGNALRGNRREVIHHLNRAKIINDLFAFANATVVKFDLLYEVFEFLTEETNFSVWNAAIKGLRNLRESKLGSADQANVEAYALRLMKGIIAKLGYDVRSSDDFVTLRNRMQVLEFACKLGHQGCIDNAVALFKNFKENGTKISPSLRPVAYCYGLRNGTVEDDDFLFLHSWLTNVASEVKVARSALGCPDDNRRLHRYLDAKTGKKKLKKDLNLRIAKA